MTSLKALRAAIEAGRTTGGRLRPEARAEVGRLIERAHGEGATYSAIAGEVGVSEQTLQRWRAAGSTSLAVVRVVDATQAANGLVVHGPRGLRIEGLSLDDVATLLGRLLP